ncbi:MAG: hypothetical protein DRH12_06390 [Deltaproteobacteria bacterium]|nr:MAG: hypothetical protein DRH12_06390 [Deltaproteobacteria bacterium]
MKKIFLVLLVFFAGLAAGFFIFRSDTLDSRSSRLDAGDKKVADKGVLTRGSKDSLTRFTLSRNTGVGRNKDNSSETEKVKISDEPFNVVAINPKGVVATVNGKPVSIEDVVPPNVLHLRDTLPATAYRKYVNKAINEALLVEKAIEEGLMDDEEYARILMDTKKDLDEISSLSEEDKEWRAQRVAKTALIRKLFKNEGLVAEKVTRQEVEEYYAAKSASYNWLREREVARGTTPERIEIKVRQQIKRDLVGRRRREMRREQESYIESLREEADIYVN